MEESTPIFDALSKRYAEPTPIFDQVVKQHDLKKYHELVEPYSPDQKVVFTKEEWEYRLFGKHPEVRTPPTMQYEEWEESFLFPPQPKEKTLMNNMQEAVQKFMEVMGQTVNDAPRIPSLEDMNLRVALIEEELNGPGEFRESVEKQDLIGIADAIGDLLYVVFGAAVTFGIDIQPIFDEIHRSNMSKLGEDGKPVISRGMELDGFPKGKGLKGPNYSPPNIGKLINEQTTYGHESKAVYKDLVIPLTLGVGGPKIGEGTLQMGHNGDVLYHGTMVDVSILPILDHLGLSVSGLSMGEDRPHVENEIDLNHNEVVYRGDEGRIYSTKHVGPLPETALPYDR